MLFWRDSLLSHTDRASSSRIARETGLSFDATVREEFPVRFHARTYAGSGIVFASLHKYCTLNVNLTKTLPSRTISNHLTS